MRVPLFQTFRNPLKFCAAVLSELAGAALRWKLRRLPQPTDRSSWKKGLLIGANHIGDVLYGSSSLARLPSLFPDCEWDIIAPGIAGEVLRGNPGIRKSWDFPIPSSSASPGFAALSAERYDVALSYSTGMYVRPIRLLVRLGIPNRIGYSHKGFSACFTHHVPISYPSPYPAYFRQAIAYAAEAPPDWPLRPSVFPTTEHAVMAEKFIHVHNLAAQRSFLVCCPASRQPHSHIFSRKLLEVLSRFERENPEIQTLLLGAQDEIPQLKAWKSEFQLRSILPNSPLPLLALAELFRAAGLLLCLDSGPRHLANAVGTRVCFLRNLASQATETGKYLETETDLIPTAEASCCSPVKIRQILDSINPTLSNGVLELSLPNES
jgi:ADP-heptose:LPS heptosyltransferase